MNFSADIIFPVWNRPLETRASLACLVEHSPDTRIIIINNGSERETERILEEFAEALDERIILVSAERNVGRVAALNRGLALATSPVAIIVHEGLNLTAGWLEPIQRIFLDFPDAGLVVPLSVKDTKTRGGGAPLTELDHGSYVFMAVRRALYLAAGGFDENMDAGIWSLRDYSRRAVRAGYRTVSSVCTCTSLPELQEFGSAHRREERLRQGELVYYNRWGVENKFCVVFHGNDTDFQSQNILNLLLTASRQGCQVTCITGRRLHKWLQRNHLLKAHRNLSFVGLPLFFSGRALLTRIKQVVQLNPETVLVDVSGSVGVDCHGITLDDFIRSIEDRQSKYFS